MNVVNVSDMYYLAAYKGSGVLSAINSIYPLDLDRKYYLPKILNKKISQ